MGDIVEVIGLRQDVTFNGRQGRIIEFIEERGRWKLEMLDTNERIRVLPRNIKELSRPGVEGAKEELERARLVPAPAPPSRAEVERHNVAHCPSSPGARYACMRSRWKTAIQQMMTHLRSVGR